jgi:ubiquinone/menaquinone biosynthesis C-methylase UbiE
MGTEERNIYSNRKEVWSSWSEDYYRSLYKDVKEYPSLVMRHKYILDLFDQDGKRILDIGCGPGEMIRDLSARNCEVCGVDISAGMLEVARQNLHTEEGSNSVFLGCGNIESLGFRDKTFDGVVCAGVVEYLEDDALALGELNRVLRTGGTMIVTVRNRICPARVLDPLINRMRTSTFGRKFMKIIKGPLAKDKGDDKPYVRYRKHLPWKLDERLVEHGFQKEDFRYFHFYPFFVPLDKLFSTAFVKMGLWMERFSHSSLGFLGSGYIVKARKTRDI